MKHRIFITGAAGFIGYHLSKQLLKQGHTVLGFDNFNDYYDPKLKEDRAKELTVIRGDLCDKEHLFKVVQEFHPTHIVNLAAQAGVRYSIDHPHTYLKSNIEGFLNILELVRQNPTIKLIYASSSSVYGLNQKVPFSIDDPVDRQASFYGMTKRSNELMAHTYHHLFGIHATGLRFFTVYGPFGRPDMAYFSFTKKILSNTPIEMYNFGNMQRDFTYIDDIVSGCIAAIERCDGFHIYNLGNHKPVSLKRFIQIIENALGKQAIIHEKPMPKGDVLTTFADIEQSKKDLGYEPKTSLEEGIPLFIQWYKDYYSLH